MNIEKARAWLNNEIYSNNCAINYRTVPESTIADLESQNEIYNICLEAFRQLEQMNHYHDRLQDRDRGMTEMLNSTIAGQEILQQELVKYKAMVGG